MKSKTLITAILAGSLLTAVAVAGPALGKGKPPTTGPGCKPEVALNLMGTVVGTPAAGSFQMNVTRASHHISALVSVTPLTIKSNADTKIRRMGPQTSLATLVAGDTVHVEYRLCKADVAALTPAVFNASTTLFARHVDAHAAHAAKPDKPKPPTTGPGCKPEVALSLMGTVVGTPVAGSFQMSVTRVNHHGTALVSVTPLTIKSNAATKIRRDGPQTSLAVLVAGDTVHVQYRTCKADVATLTPAVFNASTTLFARHVDAHPAHSA